MNVQFDEEQFTTPTYGFDEEPKGMSGLLMRWGIAKDQSGANIILLILAVVFVILTIFVFAFSGGGSKPTSGEIFPDQIVPDQFSGR